VFGESEIIDSCEDKTDTLLNCDPLITLLLSIFRILSSCYFFFQFISCFNLHEINILKFLVERGLGFDVRGKRREIGLNCLTLVY
jgi:hypothetical protein